MDISAPAMPLSPSLVSTQLPSPCSSDFGRNTEAASSVQHTFSAGMTGIKELKINSLLNPFDNGRRQDDSSASSPATPNQTELQSGPSTPRLQTPSSAAQSPTGRQKLVKDNAVFLLGTPKDPVNYRPFECTDTPLCLTDQQWKEMDKQHERFAVYPSGRSGDGLIRDYQRHIPYASDKKTFFGKTSREGFEVFQYTFKMPDDGAGKAYTVMWDYQIGLVRITPFFKALKYSKVWFLPTLQFRDEAADGWITSQTTPAKALSTNDGLKELSHSITGGALAAQGYWMPYSCARAICLSFCYPIRWALTPIFGHSFLKDCLRPDQPGYGKFKISSEVISCARLEAENLRMAGDGSRCDSPASPLSSAGGPNEVPRSVPSTALTPATLGSGRELRPRPKFKLGSPFASDSDGSKYDNITAASMVESPTLSPKSTHYVSTSGWTSINKSRGSNTPPVPANMPMSSLSRSLLNEPRNLPTTSWRALDADDSPTCKPKTLTIKMPTSAHDKHRTHKRRQSRREYGNIDSSMPHVRSTQHLDGVSPEFVSGTRKRLRSNSMTAIALSQSMPDQPKPVKSVKWTSVEARAAVQLLNLHHRDAKLAAQVPRLE
ncbi:hypothetical protein BAUCODRAFT_179029 [Baudoinia panamericana UAMH 10762]|uniref:HTH APSES-type domain-containing protein n=1 Tax=Baudoinia panamericana (strain UAMH 10762) TaxID=717646 RepID=M2MUQ8_BAUPA|nr:uncharacterized protein BAUCODRAFT_179029 [Baudoinia panamericana UAMH 10762]EMD00672.1 hypothetical protein BAUCODRAFT_179029 [Baudoinia panamericana UAMH 10762]